MQNIATATAANLRTPTKQEEWSAAGCESGGAMYSKTMTPRLSHQLCRGDRLEVMEVLATAVVTENPVQGQGYHLVHSYGAASTEHFPSQVTLPECEGSAGLTRGYL